MTLSQFKALLTRYGPVVDSWPATSVTPALDLLSASTAAQDLFAEISLGADDPLAPTPALDARRPGAAAYH
jgi:hypothetical protein